MHMMVNMKTSKKWSGFWCHDHDQV